MDCRTPYHVFLAKLGGLHHERKDGGGKESDSVVQRQYLDVGASWSLKYSDLS